MERIVRNGISITIEISHPLYAVGVITLTGPHKQWRFTIDSEKHDASGRLENLNPRMRHVGMTGETTALAEVGMEQLGKYAKQTETTFWYEFRTENRRLKEWYRKNGRQVLGVQEEHKRRWGPIIATRLFKG